MQAINTQKELSIDRLEAYRRIGDPVADELIVDLQGELGVKGLWKLYHDLLHDLGDIRYDNIPERFKNYFLSNQEIPQWVDSRKIYTAERLFMTVGPLYSASLLCRSLPVGYTSMKTVKVLTSTGYLSKDVKQGTAKRLLETTQFLLNVMETGTFQKDTRGVKHVLKVRFLHALIRQHLLQNQWDVGAYDIPINQEDMAGTILTFSVGALMGLEKIHVQLTEDEKDAMVHYWAIIGYLIGVNESLLPSTYSEAKNLYIRILYHLAKPSTDGEQLTHALCNFIRGFLPLKFLPQFPEYLIEFLIDDTHLSSSLGLYPPRKMWDKVAFDSIMGYYTSLNRYRENLFVHQWMKPANKYFATSIISYFLQEFDLSLDIPDRIQKAWSLPTLKG